ncbi:MAG: hypothetical protein JWP75_3883 [Frondihabitans sp.]|nr:hypothetical protein [Frondihabitans sp.]
MDIGFERQHLTDLLTALGSAHPYLPDRISPPSYIVTPGSPFVTSGQTYATGTIHFDVTFVASVKPNAQAGKNLDDAVSAAVEVLLPAGYKLEQVSEPFALNANNATFAAITLTVNNPCDL